jgi:hypothetical protein
MWGTITVSMQLPSNFKSVYMLNIKTVSVKSLTVRNVNTNLILYAKQQ